MIEPVLLENGVAISSGLGVQMGEHRGFSIYTCGGGVVGGNAHLLWTPQLNVGIAIIANRDDVSTGRLARLAFDTCLIGEADVPCESGSWRQGGLFRSPASHRVVDLRKTGDTGTAVIDGAPLPVSVEREELCAAGIVRHAAFSLRSIGKASRLGYVRHGAVDVLEEIVSLEDACLAAPPGEYVCDASGVHASIVSDPHETGLLTNGPFGTARYVLRSVAKGIWYASSSDVPGIAVISFADDLSHFFFSIFTERLLRFDRRLVEDTVA